MIQSTSPLLSTYLSDKWDYYPQPKQVTLIVDLRPMKDTYLSGRFSNIQKLVDFYEFVEIVLSSNDTAYVWTLLDHQLDPSMGIETLTEYDEEINGFSTVIFSYMHEVHRNAAITSYQILKIRDDFAQLRAFIGE
jgi:hypothetical protein